MGSRKGLEVLVPLESPAPSSQTKRLSLELRVKIVKECRKLYALTVAIIRLILDLRVVCVQLLTLA